MKKYFAFFAVITFVSCVIMGVALYVNSSNETYKNGHVYKVENEELGHFLKGNSEPYSIVADSNRPYAIINGEVPVMVTTTIYWAEIKSDGTKGAVREIDELPNSMSILAPIAKIIHSTPKRWSGQSVSYNECWTSNYSTWNGSHVRPASKPQASYRMYPDIKMGHVLKFISYDIYRKKKYVGKKRIVIEAVSSAEYCGHYIFLVVAQRASID